MASTANWKYTHRQRGDTNAQTDGDRSKNDHSGTTDELFGRVDTQQMEGQQWRRQIANPLPKKYQLLSARQKYSVSVIVGRRSPDYRFDEPFLPIDGSIRLGRPKYIYAWATLGHHLGQLGANLTTLRQLWDNFLAHSTMMEVSGLGGQSTYAWTTLGQHLGQLGANLTTWRQLW